MGLVEVVEVEHQVALGRGVEAEVAEVGVPADDWGDPGRGESREVVRHDPGVAAKEGVRRRHHPADTDGDERRDPILVRSDHLLHRIGAALGRRPDTQAGAGDLPPQRAAQRVALLPGHRPAGQGRVRVALDRRQHDVTTGRPIQRIHGHPRNARVRKGY
jgi:hypothetical protein